MANTVGTLNHPVIAANGGLGNTKAGPAPASVIGYVTGKVYAVSANAISNVDSRDLIPLLQAGWTPSVAMSTLTHPAATSSNSGPAPSTKTGPSGKSYTVSGNNISNVDTNDLISLLHAGWN